MFHKLHKPNSEPRRLVVAIVANMKKFRIPFYQQLATELELRNITLRVVFSDPTSRECTKNDAADLEAPTGIKVTALHPLGARALVQFLPFRLVAKADLLITVQANGYLMNYVLQLLSWLKIKPVAFWGHAFNHQGNPASAREKMKRFFATKVDWWFTYTSRTSAYLVALGFPARRISVIENAVDTSGFASEVVKCKLNGIDAFRSGISGCEDPFIALYCGSLYPEKQLPFLLEVGDLLAARHANFRLLVVGDGPDRDRIRNAISTRHWLKDFGPQFGHEKARLFAASDIFLNPGLVGLAILDSFAAGLPFITAERVDHSPEFAYLQHQNNGLLLPFEVRTFADGVETIMADRCLRSALCRGATASAARLTLENMVRNVADGICRCLQSNSRVADTH